MKLNIKPYDTLKILLVCIAILLLANCMGCVSLLYFDASKTILFKAFDFDCEYNFPSIYSTLTLFLSSILFAFIGIEAKKRNRKTFFYWKLLSLIFLFLTMDEFFQIHERIGHFLEGKFTFTGVFYYAWILPYGMILFILSFLFYFKFLKHLPHKTRNLLLIAGITFTLGAIGFEMLGALEVSSYGDKGMIYIFYTLEEFFEMTGIAILIYSLLTYIKEALEMPYINIEKKIETNLN